MSFDVETYLLEDRDRQKLDQCNTLLGQLRSLRLLEVRASDYPGLASWGLASFRQLWLARVVCLLEGICAEWNARRPLNAVLLLRSLIETVAGFHYVLHHGGQEIERGDLRGFHDRVMKAMYGSHQARLSHPELPTPTNVLTTVDRLDKLFPGARRYYDGLSEQVHPNGEGITVFGDMNESARSLEIRVSADAEKFMLRHVLSGLSMIEYATFILRFTEETYQPDVVRLERKYGPTPSDWPPAKEGG